MIASPSPRRLPRLRLRLGSFLLSLDCFEHEVRGSGTEGAGGDTGDPFYYLLIASSTFEYPLLCPVHWNFLLSLDCFRQRHELDVRARLDPFYYLSIVEAWKGIKKA